MKDKYASRARDYDFNLNSMYLIWFSKDPDLFLPPVNQLRLVGMRAKNPAKQISLLYSSSLLSQTGIEEMQQFCAKHNIRPIDFEEIRRLEGADEQERKILDLAKDELDNWTSGNRGGNPAAASDICRWSKLVIQNCGSTYIDFDKSKYLLSNVKRRNVEVEKTQESENLRSISSSYPIIMPENNNDFISFAVASGNELDNDAINIINRAQATIIQNYQIIKRISNSPAKASATDNSLNENEASRTLDSADTEEAKLIDRIFSTYGLNIGSTFCRRYSEYKKSQKGAFHSSITGFRAFVNQYSINPIDLLRDSINNLHDKAFIVQTSKQERITQIYSDYSQEVENTALYIRSLGDPNYKDEKKTIKYYGQKLLERSPVGQYNKEAEDASWFLLGRQLQIQKSQYYDDYNEEFIIDAAELERLWVKDPIKYKKDNLAEALLKQKEEAILPSVACFSGPAICLQIFDREDLWQIGEKLSDIFKLDHTYKQDVSWINDTYRKRESQMHEKAISIQRVGRRYLARKEAAKLRSEAQQQR
ncbi:MAG: glycosyltransferase family 88 protein [Rickettsiaceae bacterium]|nr:glycosyltransferase family 88 protein [Rickettsiaceae bacterium]